MTTNEHPYVHHREKALEFLERVELVTTPADREISLQKATAHALLSIAESLSELADASFQARHPQQTVTAEDPHTIDAYGSYNEPGEDPDGSNDG